MRIASHRSRHLLAATFVLLGVVAAGAQVSATTEPAPEGDPDASVVRRVRPRADEPRHHPPGRGGARAGAARQRLRDAASRRRPSGEIGPGLATLEISEDAPHLHAHAAGRRDVPRRRSRSPRPTSCGRSTSPGPTGPTPPASSPASRRIEAPDDATVVLTLSQPDNYLPCQPQPARRRRTQRGRDRPREHRQRHRTVHVRGVEPGLVDHAGPQRRLLGRAAAGAPRSTFQYFTDPNGRGAARCSTATPT